MEDVGAERVEVFAFLQEIRAHEDERIARHPELLDQSHVHLARHPGHRLLLAEERAEARRRGGQGDLRDVRDVHVDDEREVPADGRQLVVCPEPPVFEGRLPLAVEEIEEVADERRFLRVRRPRQIQPSSLNSGNTEPSVRYQ